MHRPIIGLEKIYSHINKLEDKKRTLKNRLYDLEDKQFELEEQIDEINQEINEYCEIRDKHWQAERNHENSMYERSVL